MLRERRSGLDAESVDDVHDAGRQQVADDVEQEQQGCRGLLGRLDDDAVACGERGRELPHGHEDREVPRDDLTDHAERLMEVVRDGVLIELADAALLRPQHAGEVAEVVDRERDVGGERLAHRLAVLPGLGDGDLLEVLLDAVGDPVEDDGALRRARLAPAREGLPRDLDRPIDVFARATADFRERLAVDGADVLEVLALDRIDELAADVVAVAGTVVREGSGLARGRVGSGHVFFDDGHRDSFDGPRFGAAAVIRR
ncbi:hypothetical protein SRABI76_03553 [Microbacterium oxydans]|nr:hypothetical protein SRABI76_03553 [Microbacterium oxydans]